MSYIHDQQPERESDELFGEVIDSYMDAQALGDGVLVELYKPARFQEFPINRMTRHLFDDLAPTHLPINACKIAMRRRKVRVYFEGFLLFDR
jgi:hypothetical protein